MSRCVIAMMVLSLLSGYFQANVASAFDALNDPGLVAWWGFDEETGTQAADGSGNRNHGTVIGGATWVPGVHGGALSLNGSDAYVTTEQSLLNGLSAFTIAGWVSAVNTASYAGLFGQNDLVEFGFTSENGAGVGTWMSGNAWAYLGAPYPFSYPSWHHVAMTGNAARVVIYIDGQEQASDEGGMVSGASGFPFNIGGYIFNDNLDSIDGELDDVWVFSRALTQAEIQILMEGVTGTERAARPDPANDATDVPRDTVLTWNPGEFAGTHNVYFGPSFENISAVEPDNPLDVLTSQNQDSNSFDPGRLEFGKVYYWRVDEVNGSPDKTVHRGDIWSFQAEPYSIQIPGTTIAVTASSTSNQFSTPERTLDGSGLSEDGAHAMAQDTMWFSTSPDLAPWIQYEFEEVQKLDTMNVWNSNSAAEIAIGWGVKDVEIAYSKDGETWEVLAGVTQFGRAPGLPTYNTYDKIAFNGVAARYVRLNIASNWGGMLMSYSLSEVQFFMIPAEARTPEPVDGAVDVLPSTVVSWRAGREASQHTLYMSTDSDAVADGSASSESSNTNSVDLSPFDLQLGQTYYWRVDEVNESEVPPVWPGPVWRFSVPAALVVDDFERYNNVSPDRPFQTWLDGFGYSADEYFQTGYAGNGTGAGVGHDIWSLSSPYYDGDLMETDRTRPGSNKSLPLYYDNTGGVASQMDRHWSTPQDWSGHGIQTLVLYFYGEAANTGQLYVKINNTKIPYDGDASNLTRARWNPWHVDLSSLSASSVTTLSIGVDGAGASGMVLLDDIGLYRSAPARVTPVPPSTEGLVAHWQLDDGTGTTAADSAGTNHGTVNGLAQWTTGQLGSALQLDGSSAYVDCGTGPALDITDVITLSAWVNPMDAGNGEANPYIAKGDHAYTLKHGSGNGFELVLYQGAWNYIQVPVTDAFNGNWYHLAGTYDGTELKLYVNGVLGATMASSGGIGSSTEPVELGRNSEYPDRLFGGSIDDARIYHRVLSEAEILYLANQ